MFHSKNDKSYRPDVAIDLRKMAKPYEGKIVLRSLEEFKDAVVELESGAFIQKYSTELTRIQKIKLCIASCNLKIDRWLCDTSTQYYDNALEALSTILESKTYEEYAQDNFIKIEKYNKGSETRSGAMTQTSEEKLMTTNIGFLVK
jgi:hypothetical protein